MSKKNSRYECFSLLVSKLSKKSYFYSNKKLFMRIALYGFMGAGKSSLGEALAKRFHYKFVDLDREIEVFLEQTINDFFQTNSEIAFRKIEHQVLKEFIKKNDDNVILSLGGGTILQPTNRQLLDLRNYQKVYINVASRVLIERLKNQKDGRPLINEMTDEEFEDFTLALFESRRNVYEQHADWTLHIEEENFEQTLEKLYWLLNLN